MKSLLSSFIIYILICFLSVILINTACADGNMTTLKYVQNLHDRLEEISKKNDFSIHFLEPVWEKGLDNTNIQGIYTIKSYTDSAYAPDGSIYIFCNENGEAIKTFTVYIYNMSDMDYNVKLTTLIIAALARDTDIVDSQTKAEYLFSTLTYDDYSKTINVGDYVLTMAYYNTTSVDLYATHQSDMVLPEDTSEYVEYLYEDIMSNHFINRKIKVQGMMESQENKRYSLSIMKHIYFISSGNKYAGVIDYLALPIPLENGKEYIFYGTIIPPEVDLPFIRIDYITIAH